MTKIMLIVLSFALGCLVIECVSAQDCANGQCLVRPRLAPPLPPMAPVLRSVMEAQPVRRVVAMPINTVQRVVVRPYQVQRFRVFRIYRRY